MNTGTVGSHLRRVIAKTGVSTRPEMIAKVFEAGELEKRSSEMGD
jgi:DNA-binding CsgD family transcriptional regulator